MADELAGSPFTDGPAEKAPETEVDPDAPEQETDGGVSMSETDDADPIKGQPADEDDDAEDVDFEGETFRLPRKLKDALMRHADYTRKTMEIAETRKATEAEKASLAEMRQQIDAAKEFQAKHLQDIGTLTALDQQLQRYAQVDWDKLIDEDPVHAQKLDRQYRALQQQRQQTEYRIRQADQKAQDEQRQQAAKLAADNRKLLPELIPDWSDDKARQLRDYAIKAGLPERQVDSVIDARQIAILHKAFLYDQLASKRQQPKPKPEPAKPVTRVKPATAKAEKDPDKMSSEEWLKWREGQLKARG